MRLFLVFILSLSCRIFADIPPVPSVNPGGATPTQEQTQPNGYTEKDISLTAEGVPTSFVSNVNTIFGNFLLPTVDFVVPGPTPLPLIRYYNSEDSISKWLHGIGMSTNYPLWIKGHYSESAYYGKGPFSISGSTRYPGVEEDDDDYEEEYVDPYADEEDDDEEEPEEIYSSKGRDHSNSIFAYAEEDGGSILYFSAKENIRKFYLAPDSIHKGFTNVGYEEISARTNLKNTHFYFTKKKKKYDDLISWTVSLSNGGKRFYRKDLCFLREKIINKEIKPNGNQLLFTCGKLKSRGAPLKKIISANSTGQHHFGWLEVRYKKKNKEIYIHSSNEKSATYFFERFSSEPYITRVYSSDQPFTHYEYKKLYYGDTLMTKVIHPDGRYLRLKYDKRNRVKVQFAPVGKDNKEEIIYKFKYHPKRFHTNVYDANGNKTIYTYSSKKRLKSIEKLYQGNHIYKERFFWGDKEQLYCGYKDTSDEGNLLVRTIEDEDGALSCTQFFYDDYGNIIKEKTYGNLTGKAHLHFTLDDKGLPSDETEEYRKYAVYDNNRFHLCVEKSEDSGPTLTFQYKENTDLLTARFIQDGSKIKIREFYEYDDDSVLVKKIKDDGSSHNPDNLTSVTERHITYITPVRGKEDHGVGQPEEIRECYLEEGKEVLIHRTLYTYLTSGRILEEVHFDANNERSYSINYEYDRLGNVTLKAHSGGKKYVFAYDENGNKIKEELLDSGVRKEFEYDCANRLTREVEIHADGTTFQTSYTYDNASNKTSMTNKFGQETFYKHDALGRVIETKFPEMVDKDGCTHFPSVKTSYDACGNIKNTEDQNGHITLYKRTARGQPTLITYPDESTEQFFYNNNGTLSQKIDQQGVVIDYEYDFLHRVTKTIVNGTKETKHTYSAFHEISTKDPMGNLTTFAYDGAGRLIEKNESGSITTYGYDALSRRNSVKKYVKDGSFTENSVKYDDFNRIIEEKMQHSDGTLLSLRQFSYDILNNRTEVKTYTEEDSFHTEYTEYNSQRLPIKYIDALGHKTEFSYSFDYRNDLNQKVFKKKTIDPLGNKTIEIFNAQQQIEIIEKKNSKNELLAKTVFRYDKKGNKTQRREFVYANGALLREYVVAWDYTSIDLIASCIEQPGTKEEKKTTNSYKKGGLLNAILKPDGVIICHNYDEFSRLWMIFSSDHSVSYVYEYDKNDNVINVRDMNLHLNHRKTYDSHNRVIKDSIGTGVESKFSYDALSRVVAFATKDASVAYAYQSGRLHEVSRKDCSGNKLYSHTYNSFDLLGNVTKSSPIASCGDIQYTWDALGRVEKISSDHFEESNFTFDDAGNLLEVTQKDPEGTYTSTFTYDNLYQLTSEKGVIEATYENDSINNRLKKNEDSYDINGLNQLVSDGETSYQYDRNGNPTQIGSMRLYYDAFDRLIKLERPGFSRTEYAYDESHRRILKTTFLWQEGEWKQEEIQKFLFFNKREVGSLDSDNALKEFRVLGLGKGAELGASLALEVDGGVFCPIHDHRGNISLLIDTATNQPTDTYRYSAFGEEQVFGDTNNPWHFSSKRVDPESGLLFFGRRYYSPEVGRFITPDPLSFADGPNLYSYVHNSPLILIDPYGLNTTEGSVSADSSSAPSNFQDTSWQHSSGPIYSQTNESAPAGGGDTGINPILGGMYGIGVGFGNPVGTLRDCFSPDEEKDASKYPGQAVGEKIGAAGAVAGIIVAEIATAPATGLAYAAFVALRAFANTCNAISVCVNGPVNLNKTLNESFAPRGGMSLRSREETKKGSSSNVNQTSQTAKQSSRPSHLRPDANAEGPHTTFRRDQSTGRVNHYETFTPQTNPRNPNPWKSEMRYDWEKSEEHFNKALDRYVENPHIHDPSCPGGLRPAQPWEIPL